MASETLKIDANNKPVIGFVTDDANQFIKMGRIDDTTKALKVMFVGGTATFSSMTAGSVLFAGTGGVVSQDNTNLFFDTTSKQLRIGLTGAPFDVDSRVRLAVVGNVNDYSDVGVQNQNAGDSATGDFFVSADNDSSTLVGHYTDFGITSSGWNPSTAGNIKGISINTAGGSYIVGDVLIVSTGGDGNGQITVATVNGSGGVTSATVTNNGTGYVTGSGYSTTGGIGSGCKINVVSLIDFTLWSANDGYLYNSGGNLNLSTDTSGKVIKFSVGGIGTLNEIGRFTTSGLTIGLSGTTTGKILLSGATSGTATITPSAIAGTPTLTLPTSSGTIPAVTSGSGAPSSTPSDIGLIYCDTANSKVYISTATSNSSSWKILN